MRMKILIMPDSYKESMSSKQVATIIADEFRQVIPEAQCKILPIADGGEGTIEALAQVAGMKIKQEIVTDLTGEQRNVSYGIYNEKAFFEVAEIVGLQLIKEKEKKPIDYHTIGIGELIIKLVNQGIKDISIGIGGTATIDGGIGMAYGLGYRFFDEQHEAVEPLGRNLGKIRYINDTLVPELLNHVKITIISDVQSPLCGEQGAVYVYGKQKGLPAEQLNEIDESMRTFYQAFAEEMLAQAGAGAGGGLSAGLNYFLNGDIHSGIDFILDFVEFDEEVKDADLVIVGEGKMDSQSLSGKAPIGIARRTPEKIPVIAICGGVDNEMIELTSYGIDAVFPIIGQPGDIKEVLLAGEINLRRTSRNVAHFLRAITEKINLK